MIISFLTPLIKRIFGTQPVQVPGEQQAGETPIETTGPKTLKEARELYEHLRAADPWFTQRCAARNPPVRGPEDLLVRPDEDSKK